MLGNKRSCFIRKIWLLTLVTIILVAFSVSAIAIPPAAPGPPPPGKEWQWYEAHWELIPAPPPGPFEWHHAHWENGVWVEGNWITMKVVKKNREWVPAHFDPAKRIWVEGYWAKRSRAGILIPERPIREEHGPVPAPPPPGKVWGWEPGHWHLVAVAPPQPAKWVPGHWDAKLGVWVEGSWVVLDTPAPAGRAWIAGHWDPVKGIWVEGHWGTPAPPGVLPPKPRRSAGPGMRWVWDPVVGQWVARPR